MPRGKSTTQETKNEMWEMKKTGLSNEEIANIIGISVDTVKRHTANTIVIARGRRPSLIPPANKKM